MTTIIYKHALETVSNLNADLGSKTSGVPDFNGGTYALINDMISNLSSIKASIKEKKKVISKRLTDLAVAGEVVTESAVVNSPMTAGVRHCTVGVGQASTNRHDGTVSNANKLPAVLKVNSKEYTESAVFSVLAAASGLIDNLKNGQLVTTCIIAPTTLAVS